MMKKLFVLTLVLGLASGATAAITLANKPAEPINVGETVTIGVQNSQNGAYSGWLFVTDSSVADYENVAFTSAGDPSGASTLTEYPEYPGWIEFTVASIPPIQVAAGEHIQVELIGAAEGTMRLEVYDTSGEVLLDSAEVTVVPEPMTIALLGLGGLFLRRRA